MANQRRSQAYTIYDQTTNHLDMAILNGSHMVSDIIYYQVWHIGEVIQQLPTMVM